MFLYYYSYLEHLSPLTLSHSVAFHLPSHLTHTFICMPTLHFKSQSLLFECKNEKKFEKYVVLKRADSIVCVRVFEWMREGEKGREREPHALSAQTWINGCGG